jgi:hypothetical protein
MRQWQVDRLNRQTVVVPVARTKVPVWAYPIGVAAMLVIGALIWWGGQADTLPVNPSKLAGATGPTINYSVPNNPLATVVTPEDAKANLIENSINGDAPAGVIADAETQAKLLIARSDQDSVTSSLYLKDANQ